MGIIVNRPVNIERGYHVDDEHRIIWIPIAKCACMSIIKASNSAYEMAHDEALALATYCDYTVVASIRHPWDRLVSALFSNLFDARTFEERLEDRVCHRSPIQMNSHVRPQWFWLRGFKVDHWLRVHTLTRDWRKLRMSFPHLQPELEHLHHNPNRPKWAGLYEWDKIRPQYEGDFELCRDWSG